MSYIPHCIDRAACNDHILVLRRPRAVAFALPTGQRGGVAIMATDLRIAEIALLALAVVLAAGVVGLWRAGRRANGADWGAGWMNALDGLIRLFCTRYHRLRCAPIPVPAEGPAILACNHVSGLDPLLIIAACRRPVRFIIAVEQYRRFGLTWLFRAGGCIPVDRDSHPQRAYRAALKALAAGEVVALFPHGRIHLDTDPPRRLKAGVVRLATLSAAPLYPLRVQGIAGVGHVVSGVLKRSHARLYSFAPLDCKSHHRHACLNRLARLLETPVDGDSTTAN